MTPDLFSDYTKRGWSLAVIPPGEKQPTAPGWQLRPVASVDAFLPDAAVGLLMGPLSGGLMCVDLDLGADDAEAWAAADACLPATGLCDGRPGKPRAHRIYRLTDPPEAFPDSSLPGPSSATRKAMEEGTLPRFPGTRRFSDGKGRGLDLLGAGAQCVIPPSLHAASGSRRAWYGDEPGEPAAVRFADLRAAVLALVDRLALRRPRTERAGADDAPAPDADTIARIPAVDRAVRYRNYLAKVPARRHGRQEGFHGQQWTMACKGCELGVPLADALPLFIAWNRTSATPDDDATCADTLRNAYACATFGADHDPARDFEPVAVAPDAVAAAPADAQPAAWPEPQPLGEASEPAPVDLQAMIPDRLGELRAFVAGIARENQVDQAAVLPAALCIASLCVSRWAEVQPYAPSTATEPAALWTCILLDPAERKTGTLDKLRGAIWEWQRRERERLRAPLAEWAESRRIVEARLAGLRAQIGRAKPGADCAGAREEAADLAARLDRMELLHPPELLTADATAEAVRGLLHRNGEKVAVVADEAAALENILGRYSEGANLDVWLAMHAGSFAPAHRIGAGSMPLEHPAGSVCLLIQPAAVERVLSSPDAAGRGLLARFMFVKPRSMMGRRLLQPQPVEPFLRDWWAAVLSRLLDEPWPGRPILGADGPCRAEVEPRILPLDDESTAAFLALRGDVERRLGPDGDLHGSNGWGGKLPGCVARIALCLELLADPTARTIHGDTMRAACAWAPWLAGHWSAVIGAAADPHLAAARRAWRWIERQGAVVVSLRDLFTACRCRRYDRAELWDPPLELLEAHGLIRRAWDRTRRKPSALLEVNPAAIRQGVAA